jgi:hypothetical protein
MATDQLRQGSQRHRRLPFPHHHRTWPGTRVLRELEAEFISPPDMEVALALAASHDAGTIPAG